MNPDTTPTPRTNQARHTAFNGQKTDYEAYAYMAYVAETIEIELTEQINEVARLRELLNLALELYCDCGRYSSNKITRDKIRKELASLAPAPEEPCDHAEYAEPLTGSYRCRKCDKVFDIMEPIGNEWDFVNVGDKMQSGDEALLGGVGCWTPVEKLNWVGETLSNPHTWVRRKVIKNDNLE